MSYQLTSFVNPITGPLENLQNQFSQLAALHREAQTHLRSQGTSLTEAGGNEAFIGDGGVAFSAIIEYYVTASEKHMELLDQAASTAGTCISEIANTTGSAASASLNEGMVGHVLGRLTHDAVIQEGASAVQVILDDMHRILNDVMNTGGDFFGHLFSGDIGGAIHDVGHGLSDLGQLGSDALNLLEQVGRVLVEWAQNIFNAIHNLIRKLIDIDLKVVAFFVYLPYYIGYRTQSSIGPHLPGPVNFIFNEYNKFWLDRDRNIDTLKRLNGSQESDSDEGVNGSYLPLRIPGLSKHPGDPLYGYLPGYHIQDGDADLWPHHSYPWSEGFGRKKGAPDEP